MSKGHQDIKRVSEKNPIFHGHPGPLEIQRIQRWIQRWIMDHMAIACYSYSFSIFSWWFRDPFVDKLRGLLREVAFHLTGFREETKEA